MHGLPVLPLLLCVLTYAGLALGGVPWLKLDRTGFAITRVGTGS